MLPRMGTPRNPSRRNLGHEVAEVAERLGIPLYPWQRHVVDVAMELDDDGQFIYRDLVLTVPRQSGKTTLVLALMVWRLTVGARRWGSQRVTFTAQSGKAARMKLEREFARLLREAPHSFREVPGVRQYPVKATEWKLSMNNGSEHIRFGVGNYLQIEPPTDTAGHGDTLDVGVMDEAFAHQDDAIEQALEPATQTRDCAMLVTISTAGDEKSAFLWRKVLNGRKACESGEHGSVAYFEWSVPEDEDVTDEKVWHRFHPNVSNRNVLRAMRAKLQKALQNPDDPEAGMDAFRRGYCNQWPKKPVLDKEDTSRIKLTLDAWSACGVPTGDWSGARVADGQPVVLAVSAPSDRSHASLVMAGFRADGAVHVEDLSFDESGVRYEGVAWLKVALPRIVKAWGHLAVIVVDPKDPAASVIADVEASLGEKVRRVSLERFAASCVDFVDRVHEQSVKHRGEFVFSESVAGLRVRSIGDGGLWVWCRSSSKSDPSPMIAATLAVGELPGVAASAPKKRGEPFALIL